MKYRLAISVIVVLASNACSGALASDWEEESPPAAGIQKGRDTIILDGDGDGDGDGTGTGTGTGTGNQHGSPGKKSHNKGHLLQGSATAIRTKPQPPPSSSYYAQQYSKRIAEVQQIDAGAESFLRQAAINANVPPSVFRGFLEKNHPGFLESALNSKEKLLLIRGQWDDSNKPLHSLGLKFTAIKTKELASIPLSDFKVMIIDCAGEINRSNLQKVRDFVLRGGYLLSTDWALQNVLQGAFPGLVCWNRDNTDGVITDAFLLDNNTTLTKGLEGRRYTWKLDRMSQCVRILKPERVHLLARSSRLARVDPQLRVLPDPMLAGALAFDFDYGKGKVLHLVGHFDNCSNSFRTQLLPDPAPDAGISLRQALAANFIVEALSKKIDNSGGDQ